MPQSPDEKQNEAIKNLCREVKALRDEIKQIKDEMDPVIAAYKGATWTASIVRGVAQFFLAIGAIYTGLKVIGKL